MNKLQKTAKIIDTVLRVLSWATLIPFSIVILFTIIALVFGGDIDYLSSLTLGSVTFDIASDYVANADRSLTLANAIPTDMLMVAAVTSFFIGIKLVRNILTSMIDGTTFSGVISKNMRLLGWYVVIAGIVLGILGAIQQSVMLRTYDLAGLFISDKITSVSAVFDLDLSFLLVAAVIFLLSYVFKYGEQLQQESDETL